MLFVPQRCKPLHTLFTVPKGYLHTLHFDTKHCHLQRHSSLTPIYLYIHIMNFDVMRTSYPQGMVSYDVEWELLNFAFSCDAVLALNGFCNYFIIIPSSGIQCTKNWDFYQKSIQTNHYWLILRTYT